MNNSDYDEVVMILIMMMIDFLKIAVNTRFNFL